MFAPKTKPKKKAKPAMRTRKARAGAKRGLAPKRRPPKRPRGEFRRATAKKWAPVSDVHRKSLGSTLHRGDEVDLLDFNGTVTIDGAKVVKVTSNP